MPFEISQNTANLLFKYQDKTELKINNELEIVKYLHFLYEILLLRYVTNDININDAYYCAKDYYGLELSTDTMKKDFFNNHGSTILQYKYTKFSSIAIKLADFFVKKMLCSDKYKAVPLSITVYNHLKQSILNDTTSYSAIKQFIFEDSILYDEKFKRSVFNIDVDVDIQALETELLNVFGSSKYLSNKEDLSFITDKDKEYLIIFYKLIISYLTLDRDVHSADFDRLRICSIILNILYHLIYPSEMKIMSMYEAYEYYIKKNELYPKIVSDIKLGTQDLVDVILPSYLPQGLKEQLIATRYILLILKKKICDKDYS